MRHATSARDNVLFIFEGIRHMASVAGIVALIVYVIL